MAIQERIITSLNHPQFLLESLPEWTGTAWHIRHEDISVLQGALVKFYREHLPDCSWTRVPTEVMTMHRNEQPLLMMHDDAFREIDAALALIIAEHKDTGKLRVLGTCIIPTTIMSECHALKAITQSFVVDGEMLRHWLLYHEWVKNEDIRQYDEAYRATSFALLHRLHAERRLEVFRRPFDGHIPPNPNVTYLNKTLAPLVEETAPSGWAASLDDLHNSVLKDYYDGKCTHGSSSQPHVQQGTPSHDRMLCFTPRHLGKGSVPLRELSCGAGARSFTEFAEKSRKLFGGRTLGPPACTKATKIGDRKFWVLDDETDDDIGCQRRRAQLELRAGTPRLPFRIKDPDYHADSDDDGSSIAASIDSGYGGILLSSNTAAMLDGERPAKDVLDLLQHFQHPALTEWAEAECNAGAVRQKHESDLGNNVSQPVSASPEGRQEATDSVVAKLDASRLRGGQGNVMSTDGEPNDNGTTSPTAGMEGTQTRIMQAGGVLSRVVRRLDERKAMARQFAIDEGRDAMIRIMHRANGKNMFTAEATTEQVIEGPYSGARYQVEHSQQDPVREPVNSIKDPLASPKRKSSTLTGSESPAKRVNFHDNRTPMLDQDSAMYDSAASPPPTPRLKHVDLSPPRSPIALKSPVETSKPSPSIETHGQAHPQKPISSELRLLGRSAYQGTKASRRDAMAVLTGLDDQELDHEELIRLAAKMKRNVPKLFSAKYWYAKTLTSSDSAWVRRAARMARRQARRQLASRRRARRKVRLEAKNSEGRSTSAVDIEKSPREVERKQAESRSEPQMAEATERALEAPSPDHNKTPEPCIGIFVIRCDEKTKDGEAAESSNTQSEDVPRPKTEQVVGPRPSTPRLVAVDQVRRVATPTDKVARLSLSEPIIGPFTKPMAPWLSPEVKESRIWKARHRYHEFHSLYEDQPRVIFPKQWHVRNPFKPVVEREEDDGMEDAEDEEEQVVLKVEVEDVEG